MFKRLSGDASRTDPGKPTGATQGKVPSVGASPGDAAGKLAYEARRAAKAGVSLERWMADKHKRAQAALQAERRAQAKARPPAKPGLLKRLMDRAHKPL